MPINADYLTSTADILGSEVKGGEARIKLGDSITSKGFADDVPLYGVDGFVSLPNDPDINGACMAIYVVEGNQKRVIGERDNRYASKVGELQPGDRIILSRGEARFLLKAEKDSVALYTENKKTGQSMMVSLSGEDGIVTIANGDCIAKFEDMDSTHEIALAVNGGGTMTLDKDGVTITGKSISLCSPSVLLGPFAPGVPAIPNINSALMGPTGIAGIPSQSVMVHP